MGGGGDRPRQRVAHWRRSLSLGDRAASADPPRCGARGRAGSGPPAPARPPVPPRRSGRSRDTGEPAGPGARLTARCFASRPFATGVMTAYLRPSTGMWSVGCGIVPAGVHVDIVGRGRWGRGAAPAELGGEPRRSFSGRMQAWSICGRVVSLGDTAGVSLRIAERTAAGAGGRIEAECPRVYPARRGMRSLRLHRSLWRSARSMTARGVGALFSD